MEAVITGDDRTVEVDEVRITAPGLSARVEVHRANPSATRAATVSTPSLEAALARSGMLDQLSVVLHDQVEHASVAGLGTRSTSRGEPAIEVEVPGPGTGLGQAMLAVDEDGVLSWHLPVEAGLGQAHRAGSRTTYLVPRHVVPSDGGGAHRGVAGAFGRKVLRLFTFKLASKVVGELGDLAMTRWEAKNRPHRLRGFVAPSHGTRDVPDLTAVDLARMAEGRSLLFIHGTLSSIHNGYKRLPDAVVDELHGRYDGRVWAFDHPTVASTPVENVEWFAEQLRELPADATLDVDIVCHSRGGLVARVLHEQPALAGLDPDALRVGQIVFGATPNAGTQLADPKHVGTYLDLWMNILEFIPDNPVTTTLEVLLEIVKQIAQAGLSGMDGLASMDPAGIWLTKQLNVHGGRREATYRAIAAEYEPPKGSGLARFATDHLVDSVFRRGNDLVVPTEGVFSVPDSEHFPIDDVLRFGREHGVDHTHLWGRDEVGEHLLRWLTG